MSRLSISEASEICKLIDIQDFHKGTYYEESYIDFDKEEQNKNDRKVKRYYKVESERTYQKYKVIIESSFDGKLLKVSCNCPQFVSHDSCKHVGAVLYNRYEEVTQKIDTRTLEEKELDYSEEILNLFYTEKKERKVKKQIILDITLTFYQRYYTERFIQVDLKIGTDRLYSLNNKMNGFINAYKGQTKEMKFGKNFTYDNDSTYFLKEDEKIINFFANKAYKRYSDEYYFESRYFNIEQK